MKKEKMTAKVTEALGNTMEIEVYLYTDKHGRELAVHRPCDDTFDQKEWIVSEPKTGKCLGCTQASTRKEAMVYAQERLKKVSKIIGKDFTNLKIWNAFLVTAKTPRP